ncbi:MAG: hypothetical protein ACLPQS_13990 [Acidimicrobiales bacterium]
MPEGFYQFVGWQVVAAWLSEQTDTNQEMLMLEWLAGLAVDPIGQGAQRLPGYRALVYFAEVPVTPPIIVRFLVDHVNRAIRFINIRPLP